MFFHVKIFLHSLMFFAILEFVSNGLIDSHLFSLLSKSFLFPLVFFSGLLFYFFHVAAKIAKSPRMTPIPTLFVIGATGLLYFIQSDYQQNVFIVICSFVYYFIHLAMYRLRMYKKDKTAIGIISAGNMAAIFLAYALIYGIYLNYAIPLWLFMAFIMGITVVAGFQYFWLINDDEKVVLNYSLILGLVMAEVIWVLNFWPFGYLTTSVTGLIFYFVFWDIIQRHFLQKLSKRRIIANMVFLGIILMIVLSSTRWLPAV